jgi:hypothetical protein
MRKEDRLGYCKDINIKGKDKKELREINQKHKSNVVSPRQVENKKWHTFLNAVYRSGKVRTEII